MHVNSFRGFDTYQITIYGTVLSESTLLAYYYILHSKTRRQLDYDEMCSQPLEPISWPGCICCWLLFVCLLLLFLFVLFLLFICVSVCLCVFFCCCFSSLLFFVVFWGEG